MTENTRDLGVDGLFGDTPQDDAAATAEVLRNAKVDAITSAVDSKTEKKK